MVYERGDLRHDTLRLSMTRDNVGEPCTMPLMPGKPALLEMLRADGVRYIFGNPGTSEGPILDALEDYPDLRYVLPTQEGAAMEMADGYARATGRPSFVNLHIETGLANGISLLHNAREGGTPAFLTSANKDVQKLDEGRSRLDEMTLMFTKWSVEVTHAEQVPSVMRRAFTVAKTPPTGPVHVGFSANALDDSSDDSVSSRLAPGRGQRLLRPPPIVVSVVARVRGPTYGTPPLISPA